jgi:hypothetical protein
LDSWNEKVPKKLLIFAREGCDVGREDQIGWSKRGSKQRPHRCPFQANQFYRAFRPGSKIGQRGQDVLHASRIIGHVECEEVRRGTISWRYSTAGLEAVDHKHRPLFFSQLSKDVAGLRSFTSSGM